MGDTATGAFTQITDDNAWAREVTLNADGLALAFTSVSDPVSQNADGSSDLFVINTATEVITQLTHTSGPESYDFDAVRLPSISGDGTRIAFQSKRDLIPGDNEDSSYEIFAVRHHRSPEPDHPAHRHHHAEHGRGHECGWSVGGLRPRQQHLCCARDRWKRDARGGWREPPAGPRCG